MGYLAIEDISFLGACPFCINNTENNNEYYWDYCDKAYNLTIDNTMNGVCIQCDNFTKKGEFVMNQPIKAIETAYNGYRFRSRLEARWAVFFDTMGIEYEYEPEGYILSDGTRYLPDFLLYVRHRSYTDEYEPIYAEIKGIMSPYDKHKIEEFSKEFPIIILGNLPANSDEYFRQHVENFLFNSFMFIDGDTFPACFSKYDNICWICTGDSEEWDMGVSMDKALLAARRARFEHGENG